MADTQAKTLAPWSEAIGTVETISDDGVTLVCERRFILKLNNSAVVRCRSLLRLGRSVAILFLDGGGVKVRELHAKGKRQV